MIKLENEMNEVDKKDMFHVENPTKHHIFNILTRISLRNSLIGEIKDPAEINKLVEENERDIKILGEILRNLNLFSSKIEISFKKGVVKEIRIKL